MAIDAGASALGLVSSMPSGPGVISDAIIREIAAAIPPGVSPFLLTSQQDALAVPQQLRDAGVTTVQLCDELTSGNFSDIRDAVPGVRIVQVIHVTSKDSVAEALRVSRDADALLLDSGNPNATIKTLGGTGQTHNWQWSREIVEQSPVPVFLAGGLNADNVGSAVRKVAPFGVDVCSGLRVDDNLDARKLAAFRQALWPA